MSFGYGFSLPGWQTLSGGFSPASLFTGGEQGAWYDPSDLTTLFQDSAGTTPVTAIEQPVGLMLDKRVPVGAGYYSGSFGGSGWLSGIGTTSSFNFMHNTTALFTFECWIYAASTASQLAIACNNNGTTSQIGFFIALSAGGAVNLAVTNGGGVSPSIINASSTTNVSANTWTHIAITYDQSLASANAKFYVNGVAAGTGNKTANTPSSSNANNSLNVASFTAAGSGQFNGYISNLRITNSIVYTGAFTPSTTPLTAVANTALLTCQSSTFVDNSTNAFAITKNSTAAAGAYNPFGNHAFQSTSASRPTLSARVNLLTKTEQFDDAVWDRSLVTVNANTSETVDPIGGNTADKTTQLSTTSSVFIGLASTLTLSATTHTVSISLKPSANTRWFRLGNIPSTGNGFYVWFDCSGDGATGTTLVVGTVSTTSYSITKQANGWYRCSVTAGSGGAGANLNIIAVDADGSGNRVNNGVYYIWGADLRVTNDGVGIPVYQRVNTSTDYDTAGFPTYLRFDGSDDSMLTNSVDFSATDKMTVWAGVRKLSDAAQGVVAELSATIASNNGTFLLAAPDGATQTYGWDSKGTTQVDAVASSLVAPRTNVLTGIADIAGDSCVIRVNGADADTETGDQGSGNFGNYPLFIGSRNQASARLNGRIYSLVVRGAQSTAAQIASTEAWVNGKTKAY